MQLNVKKYLDTCDGVVLATPRMQSKSIDGQSIYYIFVDKKKPDLFHYYCSDMTGPGWDSYLSRLTLSKFKIDGEQLHFKHHDGFNSGQWAFCGKEESEYLIPRLRDIFLSKQLEKLVFDGD